MDVLDVFVVLDVLDELKVLDELYVLGYLDVLFVSVYGRVYWMNWIYLMYCVH